MKRSVKLGVKRILTSVLLTVVLLFTGFSNIIAAPANYGSFTLEIVDNVVSGSVSNARIYDLSGIKIDIYDSVLERYDADVSGYLYAHSYSFSAYTDKDGSVTFKKPSERFLIEVDLTTLPDGIGIDKVTAFYGDISQRSDSLNVSSIADVVVSYDSSAANGVLVSILNANGEEIKAHYTINPDTVSNARSALYDKTSRISGSVTVGSIVEYYDFIVKVTGDPIQMVADALEANQITREEALDFYLEIWNAKSFVECGTYLATQLMLLYEDSVFANQLSTSKYQALEDAVTPPKTRSPKTYNNNSYFWIYYDDANYTAQFAKDIHDALVLAYNFFVNPATSSAQLRYAQPFSSFGGSTYDVYLGGLYPYCMPSWDGTSYINISDISSFSSADLKSTVTHEYFHAITNIYRYAPPSWFNEGFSSWASRRQYGTAGNGNYEINAFLDATFVSLDNHSWPSLYGATLFPLYLYHHKGGDATIKGVLTSLKNNSGYSVYNAIGVTTVGSTSGFSQVFVDFWKANYTPQITYSTYASGMYSKPGLKAIYNVANYPNGEGHTLNYLSSHFMEFTVPSGSNYVGITIVPTYGTSSNMRNFLAITASSGSISMIDITGWNGSMYSYLVGSSFSKGCVFPINIGMSGVVEYELTISRW